MAVGVNPLGARPLIVAFEGWNDAGDAASGALRALLEAVGATPLDELDPEYYFDYQFNRPVLAFDQEGRRRIEWPRAVLYGPAPADALAAPERAESGRHEAEPGAAPADVEELFFLTGIEPSRSWRGFTSEVLDLALAHDVTSVVFLGAMLADVPHTRPISTSSTSDDARIRAALGLDRSGYEGPIGILTVLAEVIESNGIPTVTVWASVPHYVHNAPSPKATLALVERLEDLLGVPIPRGDLVEETEAWESGIDALAAEDEDMAGYIHQLEQARDTVDSPEASGEAIAREFERYLRRRGDGGRPGGPRRGWEPS